jgi:uncharacterized protein (TIGR00369 family)
MPHLPEHSATVHYHAPSDLLPLIRAADGLTFVQAVRDGLLPPDPFIQANGLTVTEVEPGRVTFVATPGRHQVNFGGFLHGGYVSTLLDCATGYAVMSTLPQGATAPHVAASYQFLSSGPEEAQVICRGEVLRAGTRVAHVRGELRSQDGRLLAVAQTTHAIIIDAPAKVATSR